MSKDYCRCGHERKHHAKIVYSPNYTQGRCSKCGCKHFVIERRGGLNDERRKT